MLKIAPKTVVHIDYTLTGPDGQVIDSSKGREPLAYLHGASNIIPGLERALDNRSKGDSLVVTVPPDQGYGERDPELVQAVPLENFKGLPELKAGMQLRADTPGGPRVVTVAAVDEQNVTIDANHRLAGVPLTFDVTVVEVRKATDEEVAHGHPHGPGGHHH